MHPRCLRLGLIEASAKIVIMTYRTCIRGVYASASLKLRGRRRWHAFVFCIRGVYASASLKRGEHLDFDGAAALHPRCLRLGLIEASCESTCPDTTYWHPRCLRLGLIEARMSRIVPPAPDVHPRCLRLGLIEAGPVCRGWSPGTDASEVFTPRPH